MYRIQLTIVNEDNGHIEREVVAYVDSRFEVVCLNTLRKIADDAERWFRQLLKET